MKELAVISGKGGTGKTSIVAAFATLAPCAVLADCDVDASNLHLVLTPQVRDRKAFNGHARASIHVSSCTMCGLCQKLCRFAAIAKNEGGDLNGDSYFDVDAIECEGCAVCAWFCPEGAVSLETVAAGAWFVSDTRYGPMVHAKLGVAQEVSGKLVLQVRSEARGIAMGKDRELVIIDGRPGIGYPAIASVSGADMALVVTEPSPAGVQGFVRASELTARLGIPTAVCVNKWDLNPEAAGVIEEQARGRDVFVAGRVRFDPAVSRCQRMKASIIEYTGGAVSQDIRSLWRHLVHTLG